MDYGIIMFPTDYAISPDKLGVAAEERGFESVWFPEHTHIPSLRASAWPGGPDLPKEYWHTYDPFIALSFVANATKDIKLGTGICLVIERDPITLAKEIASLDRLSGGRFIFGVGGGWNAEEMENHGTAFKNRFSILRENILAMKAIWQNAEAEFHGKYVEFDKILAFPKPAQVPHPPVLIGGDGKTTFDRVLEFGDGWMPIWGRTQATSQSNSLEQKINDLKNKWTEAGRDIKDLNITLFGVPADEASVEKALVVGANRIIFATPCDDEKIVLPHLDKCAKLIQR
jgi:probable F420-dependent oxidoreductase|tara:strand:- start:1394 stop:2251 length:858 start_codon:yes stop_codon:yes gene_type:complete